MDVNKALDIANDVGDEGTRPRDYVDACEVLAAEVERLREEVRVLSSPQRLSETLAEFVREQAARSAGKGGE